MNGLRVHRVASKLTRSKLAKMLGVSAFSIYRWETKRANPSLECLKQMSQIFNCTIDELLKGE